MTPSDRLREAALYGDWLEVDDEMYEMWPRYCTFDEYTRADDCDTARTFLLLVAEAME